MATITAHATALYGFSRGTQASLSIAQPLTAALLAAGQVPAGKLAVLVLGAFAGFFAAFAANDLLDARLDEKRFEHLRTYDGPDLDTVGGRHPLAQGQLSQTTAKMWVVGLGLVAAGICALFSWVSLVLFLTAVALEVAYCKLATVTCYKTIVSGVMVAVGACAGWFAMTSSIDPLTLGLLVVWMIAWEIGGRNIPNDIADADEDVHLRIATIPVLHGPRVSALVSFTALMVAAVAGIGLMCAAFPATGPAGPAGVAGPVLAVAAAGYTLIVPGVRLLKTPDATTALTVFNRASFHPVLILVTVGACLAMH